MNVQEQSLRERLGLPESKFVDGPPPRPVDMDQLRAYHAGEVEQEIREEILDLILQYREWGEASTEVLRERMRGYRAEVFLLAPTKLQRIGRVIVAEVLSLPWVALLALTVVTPEFTWIERSLAVIFLIYMLLAGSAISYVSIKGRELRRTSVWRALLGAAYGTLLGAITGALLWSLCSGEIAGGVILLGAGFGGMLFLGAYSKGKSPRAEYPLTRRIWVFFANMIMCFPWILAFFGVMAFLCGIDEESVGFIMLGGILLWMPGLAEAADEPTSERAVMSETFIMALCFVVFGVIGTVFSLLAGFGFREFSCLFVGTASPETTEAALALLILSIFFIGYLGFCIGFVNGLGIRSDGTQQENCLSSVITIIGVGISVGTAVVVISLLLFSTPEPDNMTFSVAAMFLLSGVLGMIIYVGRGSDAKVAASIFRGLFVAFETGACSISEQTRSATLSRSNILR
jgi:hypothetical protein